MAYIKWTVLYRHNSKMKYLTNLLYVLTAISQIMVAAAGKPKGKFWHITDIHWDKDYSETGDPSKMCHVTGASEPQDNGYYGNFNCDSPWNLVSSAVYAMKNIEPNPDFIIWTGDNAPHLYQPEPTWPDMLQGLKNISLLLDRTFTNVTILPTIGNHDTFPPNKIAAVSKSIYTDYLKRGLWEILIPNEAWTTFLKGGFYSITVHPGLKVIGLNTILWFYRNDYVHGMADPADHFSWLEKELNQSKDSNQKVYLTGHVSPGQSPRGRPGIPNNSLYFPEFNKEFSKLVKKYKDVIAGQFYGHLHYDSFELYREDNDVVANSALLASSVTPWFSSWPQSKNLSVPVNPSVRLVHYSTKDGSLLDYEQYFLDLTAANKQHSDQVSSSTNNIKAPVFKNASWELLYTFTKAYGASDLSSKSLSKLYDKLKSSSKYFNKYFKYATAGKDIGICASQCRQLHLCSIKYVDHEKYKECVRMPEHVFNHNNCEVLQVSADGKVVDLSCPKDIYPSSNQRIYIAVISCISVLLAFLVIGIVIRRIKYSLVRRGPRYSAFP